jgi:hypothetical protein
VAQAIETTMLFILLRKRLNGIKGEELTRGAGAAILGSLGMGAVLLLWLPAVGSHSAALTTLGGVAIGGLTYGLVLTILRVSEVRSIFRALQRRLVKK